MKTEFVDANEKAKFVNGVLTIATKAMTDGDTFFNLMQYPSAKKEYVIAIDGFMHLMKVTADDANFQTYLKK